MNSTGSLKKDYSSPVTEIVHVNSDGIFICISGDKKDYNDGGTMNWGYGE